MNSVQELIVARIKKEGPISFRNFMEMALYYPRSGYYTGYKNRIGVRGDYYTSPSLTPAFGATVSRQLEEMWNFLGKKEFTIVEFGAGSGLLCSDILHELKKNPELYEQLNYRIIEKDPAMQEKKGSLFAGKVRWHNGVKDIPPITGCILSNELIDNFPVHQVVMKKKLMEVFIDHDGDRFCERLVPAAEELADYLAELKVVLPEGFRTEINLDAIKWIKEVAGCINKGYVLTIDYGYRSAELYSGKRRNGTLKCYHKHKINEEPYKNIGEQDITAHVNFSALCQWGLKNGLKCCGFTEQAPFLCNLGIEEQFSSSQIPQKELHHYYRKRLLILKTLLMDMGSKYKILIQCKGIAANKPLAGLASINQQPTSPVC